LKKNQVRWYRPIPKPSYSKRKFAFFQYNIEFSAFMQSTILIAKKIKFLQPVAAKIQNIVSYKNPDNNYTQFALISETNKVAFLFICTK